MTRERIQEIIDSVLDYAFNRVVKVEWIKNNVVIPELVEITKKGNNLTIELQENNFIEIKYGTRLAADTMDGKFYVLDHVKEIKGYKKVNK